MFYHLFKVSYLVVFYFLLSNSVFAQDSWSWLNPKPMGYSINGAAVVPGTSTIIAVGAKGVITRSTDAGVTWNLINTDSSYTLNSVSFPNSTTGYACGNNSTVLKTTNAGENWSIVPFSPSGTVLSQVQFLSSTIGFLLLKDNSLIYWTTNGGSSWDIYATSFIGNINSFEMLDQNNGFLVTVSGYVGKITPGSVSSRLSARVPLDALDFYDGNTGVALGNEAVYKTSDAGLTWDSSATGFNLIPRCVAYSSQQIITAVSASEYISVSTNGGSTWSSIPPISVQGLNSIVFLDQNNGRIFGQVGNLYSTSNGGANWTKSSELVLPEYNQLNSMVTLDGITIWAAGSGGKLIKSTDGGSSWATATSPITSTINSIEFTSPLRGYLLTSTNLFFTSDGGSIWGTQLSTSAGSQEVAFSTLYRGYLCGTNGIVRYSTSGSSWATPATLPAGAYYSIATTPDTMITYICGYSGADSKIIKTTNAGRDWTTLGNASFSGVTFYAICFQTATKGWVVGSGGNIYKTTDGGSSWNLQTSNTNAALQSVSFFDENHGIAVGNGGVIIKTTNGGSDWVRASEVTDQTLMSTLLFNEYSTLIAGQGSVLLKSYNAPLPVELTTFSAAYRNGIVTLNWETKTEIDNYGFEIERKSSTTGWQKIGFVEGHFTTNSPKYYNFTDRPNGTGKIQYRLKQIDNDGSFEYSHIAEVFVGNMPNGYLLEQNYPNPFNPSTTIGFTTQSTGFVKLVVYNPLGETVKVLFSDIAEAGRYYKLEFDAIGLNSGVYFYRLEAENFKTIKKLTLVK